MAHATMSADELHEKHRRTIADYVSDIATLGNIRVASLVERHLQDHAAAIMRINEIMPEVVIRAPRKDAHQANDAAVEATNKAVNRAWQTR